MSTCEQNQVQKFVVFRMISADVPPVPSSHWNPPSPPPLRRCMSSVCSTNFVEVELSQDRNLLRTRSGLNNLCTSNVERNGGTHSTERGGAHLWRSRRPSHRIAAGTAGPGPARSRPLAAAPEEERVRILQRSCKRQRSCEHQCSCVRQCSCVFQRSCERQCWCNTSATFNDKYLRASDICHKP